MNRRTVIALAALAVLLRLCVFWTMGPTVGSTAFYYEAVAQNLLKGKGFTYYPYYIVNFPPEISKSYENLSRPIESIGAYLPPDPKLHVIAPLYRYPPAYPIFLAATHAVFGPSPAPVVLIQILLNGFVVWMVCRIAMLTFQSTTLATLAGLAYAIWPFTLLNSLSYEPTALLYVSVLGAVWAFLEHRQSGRIGWLILSGALCGLSALLRTDALFAVFGLMAACFVAPSISFPTKFLRAALVFVVTVAVMSPWFIRNYAVHGRFVSLSCGLGINLVIGIGKYVPESGLPAYDRKVIEEEYGADYLNGPYNTDDGCYPDGINREQGRAKRARAWIREHPAAFLRSCVTRAPDLFFVGLDTARNRLHAGGNFIKRSAAFFLAWIEPLVFVMAAFGAWVFRNRWRSLSPLVLVIVLYALGHLPMWVEPRYFKPVWPLILMFACAPFCQKSPKFDLPVPTK